MKKQPVALAGLCLIVALAGVAPVAAQAGTFERVYHSTETSLPGFSGSFEGFDGVNVAGSKVIFRARGTDYQGIFEYDGAGYRNLIDTATAVPGISSPLTIVRESAVSGGSMAFTGRMPPSGPVPEDGIYVQDASGTRLEVSRSQMNPVYTDQPISFYLSSVAYADGRVVFHDSAATGGYYQSKNGVLSALVYRGQPIPGSSSDTFQWFDASIWAKGDNTVFIAGPRSFRDMVWVKTPDGLAKIAAEDELIPGAPNGEKFSDLNTPRMNGRGQVAFQGSGGFNVEGVYLYDDAGLRSVISAPMAWEGASVHFATSLDNFALGENFVMVGATIASGGGTASFLPEMFLVKLDSGETSVFLRRGDTVDGRIVASSRLYPYSVDGDRVAIGIRFTDGTSGIYLTSVGSSGGCAVDLNGDGVVDFADYLEFLNLFDVQDPRVDFNEDGVIDFADYLEFLNLFDAGC